MQDDDYYESKTDVCVFGDRKGYDYLIARLASAKTAKQPVRVADIVRVENSMQAVVLPARKIAGNRPRLKLWERIIFERGKPAMELVMCGNRAGYNRLAGIVRSLAIHGGPPLLDHSHVDDWVDDWVIKRSVSLNVRAPLAKWSRASLDYYADAIYGPNPYRLPPPEDINYLKPWPYTLPELDPPFFQS